MHMYKIQRSKGYTREPVSLVPVFPAVYYSRDEGKGTTTVTKSLSIYPSRSPLYYICIHWQICIICYISSSSQQTLNGLKLRLKEVICPRSWSCAGVGLKHESV